MPSKSSPARKKIAVAIDLTYSLPWYQDCYQGIQRYADQHDWTCVVDPLLVGMTRKASISDYDGVVGRIDRKTAKVAAAHGLPAVSYLHSLTASDVPTVRIDARAGAKLAGEHLVMNGFQRFAYLGGIQDTNDQDLVGFTEALSGHEFPAPTCCYHELNFNKNQPSFRAMRDTLTHWLGRLRPPVGILVRHLWMGNYVAQTCHELGLKIPNDVGIVIRVNDNMVVTNASPTLTSIDFDFIKVGYEAAAQLDKLMRGIPASPMHRLIGPRRLIMRESTDVFVCPDPMISEAMHFIAEHCREALGVEDVAEAMNTSRRTLERRFQQVLGRSIYAEMSRLRTDYISRVLVESDRSLAAIASHSGFSSASHFTRFFRKETGLTPGQYRKQFQSKAY